MRAAIMRMSSAFVKASRPLYEWRDQNKKKLAAIDRLSVENDGVLFSDGSFVGPDTEMKIDRFEKPR